MSIQYHVTDSSRNQPYFYANVWATIVVALYPRFCDPTVWGVSRNAPATYP